MNEVLSVIKEMVFNNSILLNAIVFIIIFNIFLMLFTYIYIKIYKDDFFDLFFGKEKGLLFREVGGDLVVAAYWFLMRYSFEVFSSRKTRFPSCEDILNKPFYMTPNAYKENINLFKIKRNSWLVINLISLYITYFLAILFLLYLVFLAFLICDDGFFEDLENIGIRDIIVTNDIFLICAFLIIPFGILLLLFTYMYNKVYIKNNQRDFLVFFFGEKGGDDFSRVGGDLVVVAYWFLIYYSNYKTFSAKLHFPSINDEKNKPIPIIPNTYRENVKVFEEKHKGWLLLNLSSMYLGFILGIIFLVYGFFMEG